MPFRFTLLGDGNSDRALVPVIEWVLARVPAIGRDGYVLEFSTGKEGNTRLKALAGRIDLAMREFPSDLLFVHRDAEGEAPDQRYAEIAGALAEARCASAVPVVPVRMTEAWLLFDEAALRTVAGNPNGRVHLQLPPLNRLESAPDPKTLCNELMVRASESSGRRRDKLNRPSELAWRRVRLAQLIANFEPLLVLPGFNRFYNATIQACERLLPVDE